MSRRFRPFYVAAFAVFMVGLYGTEVVPKSHTVNAPECVAPQTTDTATVDYPNWLGPQVKASTGLLDLTASVSILPFDASN
jgi:hypothetical protein